MAQRGGGGGGRARLSSPPSSAQSYSDDPALLEAIADAEVLTPPVAPRAAPVPPSPPPVAAPASPSPAQTPVVQTIEERDAGGNYTEGGAYQAIRFGDFGTYMRNKRAKLKVQENEILAQEQLDRPISTALAGCVIYINGHTDPPYAELRRLIILHGGQILAYLDQKRPCTHIVASSLPPKKRLEFRRYKVVKPGWVLESCRLGHRADWTKWQCEGMVPAAHLPLFGESAQPRDKERPAERHTGLLPGMSWRNAAHKEVHGDTAGPDEQPERPAQEAMPEAEGRADEALQMADELREEPGTAMDEVLDEIESPKEALDHGRDTEMRPEDPAANDRLVDLRLGENEDRDDRVGHGSRHAEIPRDLVPGPPQRNPRATREAAPGAPRSPVQHPYYSQPSNQRAARLLASPSWRAAHTAASSGFLAGFYARSRLHHLSTWKSDLQELVGSAASEAGRSMASPPLPPGSERILLHLDFDSFFVSVGLRQYPELRDKPVVVCHAEQGAGSAVSSTAEVASCNYAARAFGIRNGMSLGQARKYCAQVQTIPYTFDAYHSISLQFYALLLATGDAIEAVSVDEALLDVSLLVGRLERARAERAPPRAAGYEAALAERFSAHRGGLPPARALAEAFRDVIRSETGCEVSIGIGANVLQARLATRKAKPAGSFHLAPDEAPACLLYTSPSPRDRG